MKNSVLALCLLALVGMVGCGQQRGAVGSDRNDSSIIGGKAAVAGSVVAVSTVGLAHIKAKKIICTASILSSKILLTAAHCVEGMLPSDLRIVFGAKLAAGVAIRTVSGYKFHEKWLKVTDLGDKDLGDIAIIKFDGGLPAGFSAARILSDSKLLKDGNQVVLAGYGHSDGVNKVGSGLLRRVVVNIQNAAYSVSEVLLDQSKGKGACQGDSGGPAYAFDKDGKLALFGITSRGSNDVNNTCGVSAIYTSLLAYKDWLKTAAAELLAAEKQQVASN